MPGTTRIPRKDSEFDSYINNTADYLAAGTPTTNGVRLGLSPVEVTSWGNQKTSWNTNYALYIGGTNNIYSNNHTKANGSGISNAGGATNTDAGGNF